MAYLLDTTILARLANVTDAQHFVAARAVLELHRRGEVLHLTPQVLIEFRNVATRPVAVNGLGLSAADAEAQAGTFEKRFPLLGVDVVERADVLPGGAAGAEDGMGVAQAEESCIVDSETATIRVNGFLPGRKIARRKRRFDCKIALGRGQ